jgi:beta-lactamase class A
MKLRTRRARAAVFVVAVLVVGLVAGTALVLGSSGSTSTAAFTAPVHKKTPAKKPVDPFGGVTARGTVLAAVYDVASGQEWNLGTGRPQAEASIVKLDILQTLLAREHAATLPAADLPVAQQMMEYSDNDAATSLWYAAGGSEGIGSYNAAVGLRKTTLSKCVECTGFPWPGWGLTTTTPDDQITLLRQLISPSSRLSASQRAYVRGLMKNVTPQQRWGVSGGVPDGVTVALKNGWLPLDDADHDWQINSIGWIDGDGRNYLIAVLTTGNATEQAGISLIDGLSSVVWRNMEALGR